MKAESRTKTIQEIFTQCGFQAPPEGFEQRMEAAMHRTVDTYEWTIKKKEETEARRFIVLAAFDLVKGDTQIGDIEVFKYAFGIDKFSVKVPAFLFKEAKLRIHPNNPDWMFYFAVGNHNIIMPDVEERITTGDRELSKILKKTRFKKKFQQVTTNETYLELVNYFHRFSEELEKTAKKQQFNQELMGHLLEEYGDQASLINIINTNK